MRAADQVGVVSHPLRLNAEVAPTEVLDLIERLNADPDIHRILIQLPLAGHFRDPVYPLG
jgi:methylenetetrahydrofolate dehydrogenase (NADP+)/methenyltetrahydrofolate cyclohydrolase